MYSEDPNVDAVGACIGEKGSRINRITNELGGEKIDVVLYDKDEKQNNNILYIIFSIIIIKHKILFVNS